MLFKQQRLGLLLHGGKRVNHENGSQYCSLMKTCTMLKAAVDSRIMAALCVIGFAELRCSVLQNLFVS